MSDINSSNFCTHQRSFLAPSTFRFHQFQDVRTTPEGLWRVHALGRTHSGYVRRSAAAVASLEEKIRSVLEVRFLTPAGSSRHAVIDFGNGPNRQDPRRILSLVNEPQPEPETNLFNQFAKIDEGILAWDFTLRDAYGQGIASVNRAFRGFGREVDSLSSPSAHDFHSHDVVSYSQIPVSALTTAA